MGVWNDEKGRALWIWNWRGYLAGVELSGRGFNPRPAQGRGFNLRPAQGWGATPPTGARSGSASPDRHKVGKGKPRPAQKFGIEKDVRQRWGFPVRRRSGVEPPTGTIHPRESRGWMMGVWNDEKGRALWIWNWRGYLAGVELSGRGFNPRPAQGWGFNPRPAQGRGFNLRPAQGWGFNLRPAQGRGATPPTGARSERASPDRRRNLESKRMSGKGGAFQSGAGRGLNPRPERSIHAKAEDG